VCVCVCSCVNALSEKFVSANVGWGHVTQQMLEDGKTHRSRAVLPHVRVCADGEYWRIGKSGVHLQIIHS